MKLNCLIPVLTAALSLAIPSMASAGSYKNHYSSGHYSSNCNTYRGGYGGSYRGGYSRSYGGAYYGGGYGNCYRPAYYGTGFYGYPSIGISFATRSYPVYGSADRIYRGRQVADSSYNDLSVSVQRALRQRGYYRGSIDGDIGSGSRSAIRAYQADRGLSVNGRIDSSLLRSLGLS